MKPKLDRREFHELSAAALAGLAAGATIGCSSGSAPGTPATTPATQPVAAAGDVHLCRGLNECKGQGKGSTNDCRGQGACATAKEHTCGGQNDCKALGGCGATAGANACKGQGGCQVPLMEGAWAKLRAKKEAEWTAKSAEFAAAPAKAS